MSAPTLVARDPGLDPARVPVLDPDAPLRSTRGWVLPLRLARRDAAQHPWRTALGMLMVGVPVFVALTTVFVLRTDSIDAHEAGPYTFGQADGLVADMREEGWGFWDDPEGFRFGTIPDRGDPPAPGGARSAEEIAELVGSPLVPITRGSTELVAGDGAVFRVRGTEYDSTQPVTDGLAILDAGRLPRESGEAAVSPDLATRAGVGVGDTVAVADQQLTVTGIAIVPVALGALEGLQVIASPGTLAPALDRPSTGYLITGDLPGVGDPVLDTAEFRASGFVDQRWEAASLSYFLDSLRSNDDLALTSRAYTEVINSDGATLSGVSAWAAWLAPVYALVVIQLAVMSAPALAVGVRQSRRMFALLQGAGADGRALRRTVFAQAGIIGLVGSGLAAALAVVLVAGAALAGWWPERLGVRGPLDVRWVDVVLAVGVATGSTLLAGVLPARRVAASPPVGSLAGRRASPGLPWRRAVWGAAAVVLSLLLVWATGRAVDVWSFAPLAVLGLVVGMLLLVPLIVAGLGLVADRLPLSGFVAMRDAARAPGRSVAAVATVAIAVAAAVSASMTSTSLQAFDRAAYEPRYPHGMTVVQFGFSDGGPPALHLENASEVAAAVEDALPGVSSSPVGMRPFDTAITVADDSVNPFITEPEAVPAFGYPVDSDGLEAMAAGAILLVAPDMAGVGDGDEVDIRVDTSGELTESRAPVTRVEGRVGQPFREILMTPETAADLGIPFTPTTVLVDGPDMLTVAQENELEAALSRVALGAFVYTERGYQANDGLTTAIRLLILAAILVVVLGTLTATALAVIDTRRDRDLLAAAGASPRTGRGVGAATAVGYAGTGALVGTVLGLLLGLLFAVRTIPAARGVRPGMDPVVVVPWGEIAVLVVGLPLALGAVTWLVARGGSALAGAREASRV